jgi:hypothetical protein
MLHQPGRSSECSQVYYEHEDEKEKHHHLKPFFTRTTMFQRLFFGFFAAVAVTGTVPHAKAAPSKQCSSGFNQRAKEINKVF